MVSIRQTRPTAAADAFAAIGLLAVGVAAVFPWIPWLQRSWPSCHFLELTGLPCGTCGFTRAFVRAAALDPAGAFRASPLGAALFLCGGAASLWIAARLPLPRLRLPAPALRWGPLVLFLANWAWLVAVRLVTGSVPA